MAKLNRQDTETRIRALTEANDYARAAELTLELYGNELLGFMMGTLQDRNAVEDVFQNLNLEMWRALPRFEWRSSLRTWLYTLARGVVSKHLRDPYRKRSNPLPTEDEDNLPMRIARTATRTWRRTETKDRLWSICQQLPTEDRELLMLRIGRKMAWSDIATIISDEENELDASAKRRQSARLRKRYERLKEQLRGQMLDNT